MTRAPLRSRRVLRLVVLGCALAAWGLPGLCQMLVVPKKHQALYDALASQLTAFDARLPKTQSQRPLLRGATLVSMRCEHPESLLSQARRDAAAQELDALRRAGAQAIVIEICYPLLSPGFQDPRLLLEHYANLANEVRRRDLKLVVEHGALAPTDAIVSSSRYYQGLTKKRFAEERYEELKSIVIALQPDYLTMVSDPRGQSGGLKLSAKDWSRYVGGSTAALRHELGDFVQALGAGLGLWEDIAYVDAFAATPGLDFIDLHLYPVVVGKTATLDRLLTWPDRVRAIDPAKRIVISEVWLYKAGADDASNTAPDPATAAREVYGFWSPLDVRYLRAVAKAARYKDIELVAAFRSRYFFAYLDFYDPATYKASPRRLMELEEQRAWDAMSRGDLTDTGRAFGGM